MLSNDSGISSIDGVRFSCTIRVNSKKQFDKIVKQIALGINSRPQDISNSIKNNKIYQKVVMDYHILILFKRHNVVSTITIYLNTNPTVSLKNELCHGKKLKMIKLEPYNETNFIHSAELKDPDLYFFLYTRTRRLVEKALTDFYEITRNLTGNHVSYKISKLEINMPFYSKNIDKDISKIWAGLTYLLGEGSYSLKHINNSRYGSFNMTKDIGVKAYKKVKVSNGIAGMIRLEVTLRNYSLTSGLIARRIYLCTLMNGLRNKIFDTNIYLQQIYSWLKKATQPMPTADKNTLKTLIKNAHLINGVVSKQEYEKCPTLFEKLEIKALKRSYVLKGQYFNLLNRR